MARKPFSFSGWYRGWFFRSLKELSYALDLDRKGIAWKSAEKREYSTTYVDRYGKVRGHWADFVVGNTIIEVKPTRLQKNKIVKLKAEAMRKWCAEHGFEYLMVAPKRVNKDEVRRLLEIGEIIIEEHLRDKFNNYLKKKSRRTKAKDCS